jgi:hypothetical protein
MEKESQLPLRSVIYWRRSIRSVCNVIIEQQLASTKTSINQKR